MASHGPEAHPRHRIVGLLVMAAIAACGTSRAGADSTTPRLASYYDRHLAVCGGDAFEWSGEGAPKLVMRSVVQVGVGRNRSFALAGDGRLYAWTEEPREATILLDGVQQFATGDSGVLAIRSDGSLWSIETASGWLGGQKPAVPLRVAGSVQAASVGDGTNYYIAEHGDLYAKGNAHRGQYGDGRLESAIGWTRVASGVAEIRSHTGHAILRTVAGEVKGTGGNVYGPVGTAGLGDKVVRWTAILDGVHAIATGASHSLAIRDDGSLWIWGRNETPEPRKVVANVIGAAAGSDRSLALTGDGILWQWRTGAIPRKVIECRP